MQQKPSILISGTGHMAQPICLSTLACKDIVPQQVTFICGTRAGSDKEALQQKLAAAGLHYAGAHFLCHREKEAIEALPPQDLLIFGAKPQFLESVLQQHRNQIGENTTLLTLAAGVPVARYQQLAGTALPVIRVMPHLPRRVYGIYAQDPEQVAPVLPLLEGMGRPVILKQEEDFHCFTAHAGSSPAFIARYLHCSRDADAAAQLNALAQKKAVADPHSQTARFYANWLQQARADLGEEGETLIQETILGTLAHLQESGLEPAAFARTVRSPKGTTNAGLLAMGSSVPEEESFGTLRQRQVQNDFATACRDTIAPEDAIIAATRACAARSRGMEKDIINPLHSIPPLADIVDLCKREENHAISSAR